MVTMMVVMVVLVMVLSALIVSFQSIRASSHRSNCCRYCPTLILLVPQHDDDHSLRLLYYLILICYHLANLQLYTYRKESVIVVIESAKETNQNKIECVCAPGREREERKRKREREWKQKKESERWKEGEKERKKRKENIFLVSAQCGNRTHIRYEIRHKKKSVQKIKRIPNDTRTHTKMQLKFKTKCVCVWGRVKKHQNQNQNSKTQTKQFLSKIYECIFTNERKKRKKNGKMCVYIQKTVVDEISIEHTVKQKKLP